MTSCSRRRFLKIIVATSAAVIGPARVGVTAVEAITWSGVVLGAEASIRVYGDKPNAQAAIDAALRVIKYHEKQLSIYDPNSSLSELNLAGHLRPQQGKGASVLHLVDQSKLINERTDGLFDPTVQPLFEAYAKAQGYPSNQILENAKTLVGINKVDISSGSQVTFRQQGMAITFNGIAQGFITDQVRHELDKFGYQHALINIGEYSAGEDTARIGIADASGEIFEIAVLRNQAIATSSPSGYRFPDGTSHIIHPNGKRDVARWDTVSVIADKATQADGYSTALALTKDTRLAEKLVADKVLHKVVLKDTNGQIHHAG